MLDNVPYNVYFVSSFYDILKLIKIWSVNIIFSTMFYKKILKVSKNKNKK